MADGSIYVALISASAALLGAAVSAASLVYQNSRQAESDRKQRSEERQLQREEQRQRHREQVRTTCMDLLRAAVDLRTQVENNQGYEGAEMRFRLAEVRRYASDAALHAVRVAMIEPHVFADSADALAKAAGQLALAATNMRVSTEIPNLGTLNACIAAFSEKAVGYAKGLKT